MDAAFQVRGLLRDPARVSMTEEPSQDADPAWDTGVVVEQSRKWCAPSNRGSS
jgi:hypothetical protein